MQIYSKKIFEDWTDTGDRYLLAGSYRLEHDRVALELAPNGDGTGWANLIALTHRSRAEEDTHR